MQTMSAESAKTNFDQLVAMAQRMPVEVTRDGRAVGMMLGAQAYEAVRMFEAQRLFNALKCRSERAAPAQALALNPASPPTP